MKFDFRCILAGLEQALEQEQNTLEQRTIDLQDVKEALRDSDMTATMRTRTICNLLEGMYNLYSISVNTCSCDDISYKSFAEGVHTQRIYKIYHHMNKYTTYEKVRDLYQSHSDNVLKLEAFMVDILQASCTPSDLDDVVKCFHNVTSGTYEAVAEIHALLTTSSKRNDELQNDIARLQAELEQTMLALTEAHDKIHIVKEREHLAVAEKEACCDQIMQLQSELRLTEDIVGKTIAVIEQKVESEMEIENEVEIYKQMNADLVEQAEGLEQQIADCVQKLSEQKLAYSEQYEKLRKELDDQRKKVYQMEQERMARQISQDNYHVELEILQRTLEEKTSSLHGARESMQHLQESFTSQESKLDATLASLSAEKDALEQQILELKVSSRKQKDKFTRIEQDNKALEQTCAEVMEVLEATEQRCTALQHEEEAARRLAADSQAQMDVLSDAMKRQLEMLNVKVYELGMDVQDR